MSSPWTPKCRTRGALVVQSDWETSRSTTTKALLTGTEFRLLPLCLKSRSPTVGGLER